MKPTTTTAARGPSLNDLSVAIAASIRSRSETSLSLSMAYRLLGFDGAAAHDDRPVWLNDQARAVAAEAVPEVREKLRCCDVAVVGESIWITANRPPAGHGGSPAAAPAIVLRLGWSPGCDHMCGSSGGRCDAAQIFGAPAGDCSIPGLTWHGDPSAVSVDDSPEDIVTELEQLLRPAHLDLDAQRWLSESAVPPALGM